MIPHYRTLFDPGNSLYDVASQKFPSVMLTSEAEAVAPAPAAEPEAESGVAETATDARDLAERRGDAPGLGEPSGEAHGGLGEPSGEAHGSGEAGQTEPGIPEQSPPSGSRKGRSLLPYQAWPTRSLPYPDSSPLSVVIAGLREIVAAEGPIHAQRAYRLYTMAAGGRRAGTESRRVFHAATLEALQAGDLRQLEDQIASLDEKTLYAPGKPSVLLRELGPRQLSDVPRSEVAKLIKYLGVQGAPDETVKRAVLSAYGLVRLTARTSQYLDECLSYQSRPAAAASQP
jgi:hypothetical protein